MASPIEYAMMVLKAPINYEGYSNLPHQEGDQEQMDFADYMAAQGYPQERPRAFESIDEWRRLVDEFNAQNRSPASTLKAPIDRHGYSDLPHDRFSEESGMMTNQEEQDWHNWMREQGHPQWAADPESEEGKRYQQERMGSPEDTAEIRRLIDEFNAQYQPPAPTE